MKQLAELLDAAKKAKNINSDTDLAKAAGVTKGSVSNWRHGRNLPEPHVVERLAKMAGENGFAWVATVEAMRAGAKQADRRVWVRLAERLSTAASIAAAVALFCAHNLPGLYIM